MIKKQITFDISSMTIVKTVFVLLSLTVLYLVRDIIAILFTSVVIAAALNRTVDRLQKRKVPRSLSVILIYLILISVIAMSIYLLIPPITTQIRELSSQFPDLYDKFIPRILGVEGFSLREEFVSGTQGLLSSLGDNITSAGRTVFSMLGTIFGGIISAIAVLALSFYLIVQENALKNFIRLCVPKRRSPYIIDLIDRINGKIGRWLSGQIILCVVVGVFSFLGLWLLGVRYALVLAIFAGLTEVIPYIGPIVGAIPAIFLAFIQSPFLALFVVILYFIVQQLENHVFVPKIMQKAIGLNPVVVICALLIGGKLAGILGMILAVPVAAGISVFVKDYVQGNTKGKTKKIKVN